MLVRSIISLNVLGDIPYGDGGGANLSPPSTRQYHGMQRDIQIPNRVLHLKRAVVTTLYHEVCTWLAIGGFTSSNLQSQGLSPTTPPLSQIGVLLCEYILSPAKTYWFATPTLKQLSGFFSFIWTTPAIRILKTFICTYAFSIPILFFN